jgi:tetratricopeptide (TPR) repeat protein
MLSQSTREQSSSLHWHPVPAVALGLSRGVVSRRHVCRGSILLVAVALLFACGASAQLPGILQVPGGTKPNVSAHQLRAPGKARTAVEKAHKAMLEGNRDEAYKQSCRALEVYPHYSIALAIRGLMNLEAGKPSEATADFEEAIQADPDYGPPYVLLGALYNHAQRYNEALTVLTKGLQLLPSAWEAHFQMGQALFGRKDDMAALGAMTEAIRRMSDAAVEPEDWAIVHFWRALVLVQLKRFSEAKSEYERAVMEQPDSQLAVVARQSLSLLPATADNTTAALGNTPK